MSTTQTTPRCAEPDCTKQGVQPVDSDHWYCNEHIADALFAQMRADREVALDPELAPYVSRGDLRALQHPLVYQVPYFSAGEANRMLTYKRKAIADYIDKGRWHSVVWAHERPWRLAALLHYVIGVGDGEPSHSVETLWYDIDIDDIPSLDQVPPDAQRLAFDVWRDAENIAQHLSAWRRLFDVPDGVLLTDDDPDDEDDPTSATDWFASLPDPVTAYRGGTGGDWSWTTDYDLAAKFAEHGAQRGQMGWHRNYGVRTARFPKSQVFGALYQRGESELLVHCTPELWPLVHPDRPDAYDDEIGDRA